MTPYYEEGGITIYCAGCEEVLPGLSGVDLVFTSPPYNLGTGGNMHAGSLAASDLAGGYDDHDDAMSAADYTAWQSGVLRSLWDTLSADGAIFYNHKPRVQEGEVVLPLKYGDGLPLRQIVTWDRSTGMNFSDSFFLPKSEWILIYAKPGWRLRSRKECEVGDVWRVRPEQRSDHPAPFPAELPARAIQASDPAVVLDPFMGIGSTLRAAKDAGVNGIGIEKSERYCEVAAGRLAQEALAL